MGFAGGTRRPVPVRHPVGRSRRELEILTRVWERAVDAARPHLVTMLGPAGIGKSRLAERSRRVEDRRRRALWGRSLPYEERTPYRAAGQIIRRAADIYENDGVDVAREKLADARSRRCSPRPRRTKRRGTSRGARPRVG